MSEPDGRIEEALAAHMEHVELGGPEPDVSHLSPAEQERLRELIALLDQTEGVAFGLGLHDEGAEVVASTPAGEAVLATLRDSLPALARISTDPAAPTMSIPDMTVADGWVVGTFGGRIRVWLLADEGALERSDTWLRHLDRAFRLLPDTAALTLVEPDQSALIIQPEDCGPTIEVPRGSLVGRRYRRPVHPVGEAVSAFLRELTPYWEPVVEISDQPSRTVDVPPIAQERAATAVENQVAIGKRARKTNPKRKALTELGDTEASGLANLLLEIHDGRRQPDGVERALRRLATDG